MNNKNNKYKSGAFSDDDEDQKMPDASGFYELVKSKRKSTAGGIGFVQDCETEADVPAGKKKVYLPDPDEPDLAEALMSRLKEMQTTMNNDVEQLNQKLDRERAANQSQAQDIKLLIRRLDGERAEVKYLSRRLDRGRADFDHLSRKFDRERASNRSLRKRVNDLCKDRFVIASGHIKRGIEASLYELNFPWLPRPVRGDPARLDWAINQPADANLLTEALRNPSVQRLLDISSDPDFRDLFDFRNDISHPAGISFEQVEEMLQELRDERLNDEDSGYFRVAERLIRELRDLPDRDYLIHHFNNVICRRSRR